MNKTLSFTDGKIFSPLIRFALPVLLALFLQTMYGAVDLLIVGQFGGEMSTVYVSAVSTGSTVMQAITVVITGLAMGLTVFCWKRNRCGRAQESGQDHRKRYCSFRGNCDNYYRTDDYLRAAAGKNHART